MGWYDYQASRRAELCEDCGRTLKSDPNAAVCERCGHLYSGKECTCKLI